MTDRQRTSLSAAVLCICVILTAGSSASPGAAAHESIHVEIRGTLRTGVMAIGGETTGTTITANNVTWELDLSSNPAAKKIAPELNGSRVTVTGTYSRRRGVEVPLREIITVASLKPQLEK